MRLLWLLPSALIILIGCSGGGDSMATPLLPAALMASPTATVVPTATATATATSIATETPDLEPSPTSTPELPRQEWIAYLEEGLTYIENNALYSAAIDWPSVRAQMLERANTAQTRLEIYEILRDTLDLLGDDHSAFLNPVAAQAAGHGEPSGPMPEGRQLDHNIAYIKLPHVRGTGESADRYAETAVQVIRDLDAASACGWVVDLRENSGGNMWPMLAGISPVLGDGAVGSFAYPDGSRVEWRLSGGKAYEGDVVWAEAPAYTIQNLSPPVAVLTSHETGSSGEAVTIAFRGRPDTRSFGQPTAGVPTSNDVYEMPDGAWIILTVARMADRTGQMYEAPIPPDVPIEDHAQPHTEEHDPAVEAAAEWLHKTYPACHSGE